MWYVWFPTACAIAKSWLYQVYWYDDNLKIEKLNNSNIKVIVDWKNCLNKESFEWSNIIYTGIWR